MKKNILALTTVFLLIGCATSDDKMAEKEEIKMSNVDDDWANDQAFQEEDLGGW